MLRRLRARVAGLRLPGRRARAAAPEEFRQAPNVRDARMSGT